MDPFIETEEASSIVKEEHEFREPVQCRSASLSTSAEGLFSPSSLTPCLGGPQSLSMSQGSIGCAGGPTSSGMVKCESETMGLGQTCSQQVSQSISPPVTSNSASPTSYNVRSVHRRHVSDTSAFNK